MSEPFYVSRSSVRKVEGVHRRATLGTGHTFDMGVHGPIKDHFGIEAEDLPLPVDFLVATAGG